MKKTLMLLGIVGALLLCAPSVVSANTYTVHATEPSETLLVLFIIIDFILLFYTIADYDNMFYANIITGVMCIVLSFALGTMLIGGSLSSITMVANNSTGVDFQYDTYNTISHNPALGLFMVVVGLVMIVFVIMNILQLFREIEDDLEF